MLLRALLISILDEAEVSVLFPSFLIPWDTASVIQWIGRGVDGLLAGLHSVQIKTSCHIGSRTPILRSTNPKLNPFTDRVYPTTGLKFVIFAFSLLL